MPLSESAANELGVGATTTHRCPDCHVWMDVTLAPRVLSVDSVAVTFDGVPLLRCSKCQTIRLPDRAKLLAAHFVEQALMKNEPAVKITPTGVLAKRFPSYTTVEFDYSALDHDFIPGLTRPWNEGFFTPVFFAAAVLNKYAQDPAYALELFSDTYGSIIKGDEINIQFGITRTGKVIMWLGDIGKLPEAEQHYLRSENVASDHDICSEFYDAQMECVFAKPSAEQQAIRTRFELNVRCREKLGDDLYQLHGEIAQVVENLRRPIFWEEKHVAPAAESFNRIIVESLNVAALKSWLAPHVAKDDLKNLKGLKLLQRWIETGLRSADAAALCLPFFVLYDFRVLVCHLTSIDTHEEKLATINERLGLDRANQQLDVIYLTLLQRVSDSLQKIVALVA